MEAISWWHMYGGVAPELYSLAIRVLSQGVNTSCAERCWSTYSYIHSVKRNRLNCDRAEKLVFVHYNHRLLSRYREDYESFKNWDVYDDDANIEEPLPTTVKERDNAVLYESEDDDTPTTIVVGTGSSSSATETLSTPSPLVQQKTQAQMRLEIAWGKRHKK